MFELPFTDPFFQPWCKRLMVQASFCLLRVCGDSAILSISGKEFYVWFRSGSACQNHSATDTDPKP